MKPHLAQLRQQQALYRRSKLEENAARAQREGGLGKYGAMRGAPMPNAPFASTNRQERRRDPNHGLITQAEWDELVEQHEDSGVCFRYAFWVLVVIAVLFLGFSKYDEEYNLEVPQVESGRGFGEVTYADPTQPAPAAGMSTEELEGYYRTLGIDASLQAKTEGTVGGSGEAEVDHDKARRRENYRLRQEVRRAYQQHQEQQGQLVHCGRSCTAQNQQVQLAYNKLASQVDRELFGVLLDAKDTKSSRSTNPEFLKKKYDEKKELIIKTETNEEDRAMALEELKDAYDIIQDPDARKYYLLYGAKPPEHMRHVTARHGGWGQEVALGTFKYRIIIMWLDFLHQYVGIWGETAVLLSVVLFVLSRIPIAMKQSQRLLDDLEWQDQQEESREDAKTE